MEDWKGLLVRSSASGGGWNKFKVWRSGIGVKLKFKLKVVNRHVKRNEIAIKKLRQIKK